MEKNHLINLIGKSSLDESVINFLSFLSIDPKKVKAKRETNLVIVDNTKLGVQLSFNKLEMIKAHLTNPDVDFSPELLDKLAYMESCPEGSLFLIDLYITFKNIKQSSIDLEAYLPYGLKKLMSKEEVYQKIGKPFTEADSPNSADMWLFNDYKFTVRFNEDNLATLFGAYLMNNAHLIDFDFDFD